jgi:hypothetical protein
VRPERASSRGGTRAALSIRNATVSESIPVARQVFPRRAVAVGNRVTSAWRSAPVDGLTSRDRATVACWPTSSTVAEEVPSPTWYAPRVTWPAQAAAIRSRRAVSPASASGDTGSAAGQSAVPLFSQSVTVSRAWARTEPEAGGTAKVRDCTRGGCCGLSWIATATVPCSPDSHQRRCAGVSDSAGRLSSTVNAPIRDLSSARSARRSWKGRSRATFGENSASATASFQLVSSRLTSTVAARVSGHGPPAGAGEAAGPAETARPAVSAGSSSPNAGASAT